MGPVLAAFAAGTATASDAIALPQKEWLITAAKATPAAREELRRIGAVQRPPSVAATPLSDANDEL